MSNVKVPLASAEGWIMPRVSYVNPARLHCRFCGSPIPRRYWRVGDGENTGVFCNPAHAELFVSYSIPVWGHESTEATSE